MVLFLSLDCCGVGPLVEDPRDGPVVDAWVLVVLVAPGAAVPDEDGGCVLEPDAG
jgi:hypothetical protein